MNKYVELPLAEPMYSTYHCQGISSAVIYDNISIRNWILSDVAILSCNKKFLSGYTSLDIDIEDSSYYANPYLNKMWIPTRFSKGYINPIIREMINNGYYVYFCDVDDYYVEGKTWYKERHLEHDGLICGYNQFEKTYCIYAYDKSWVFRKFWSLQKTFNRGRKAIQEERGKSSSICGIKPTSEKVEFSVNNAYLKIVEYLDSSLEEHPIDFNSKAYGIVVHDYIAMYIDKLIDGTIPYEKMDYRIFRLIWEHKKVMYERIRIIESKLNFEPKYSEQYKNIVTEANCLRMMYASHHMRRRDSLLQSIRNRVSKLGNNEEKILKELVLKMEMS